MSNLETIIFVEDDKEYAEMLNKWLGATVVQEMKNDEGKIFFRMCQYDGINIGMVKPSEESPNTATKVNGSTNSLMILVDSKEKVDELFKAGVSAGASAMNEPGYSNPEDISSPYRGGLQDIVKQYWSIVYIAA